MIRIVLLFTVIGLVTACGRGGDGDGDSGGNTGKVGFNPMGASGQNYDGMMDGLFNEVGPGQFVAETPAEGLDEPISGAEVQALANMLSELNSQGKQQVQTLVLNLLDACSFFNGGNLPCNSNSPWGCANNLVAVGGDFFLTLLGHLGSNGALSSEMSPAMVMAEEVGMCHSIPIDSPHFETRMNNAKQQCMAGSLRGCIRFGLSLIKMFLKALLGALLGAIGM